MFNLGKKPNKILNQTQSFKTVIDPRIFSIQMCRNHNFRLLTNNKAQVLSFTSPLCHKNYRLARPVQFLKIKNRRNFL